MMMRNLRLAMAILVGVLANTALAHGNHWNYEQPELWGSFEGNELCTAGEHQSPINITQVAKPNATDPVSLFEHYKAQNFRVINNGNSIVFEVEGKTDSHILLNGQRYDLAYFQYRTPSEHAIMSTSYPVEIQFVHKNAEQELAVISLLAGSGRHNADLNRLLTNLPKDQISTHRLEHFNIGWIMPSDASAYHYEGSLTTPPCSEAVKWVVKSTPISADGKQLATLFKFYNGNARPVQPQNGRAVTLIR